MGFQWKSVEIMNLKIKPDKKLPWSWTSGCFIRFMMTYNVWDIICTSWDPPTFTSSSVLLNTFHTGVMTHMVMYHLSLLSVSLWQIHCHFYSLVTRPSCCPEDCCNHSNSLYNLLAHTGENMERVSRVLTPQNCICFPCVN